MADDVVQIRGVGAGLRISDAGVLTIDTSRNLTWSGSHVFGEPVQFSGAQKYFIDQVVDYTASIGTVYWHNGISLQKAVPAQSSKVLFFDGSRVSWSFIPFECLTGVATVDKGGTGITKFNRGDLVFAKSDSLLNRLNIGSEGQSLIVKDGLPAWGFVGTITGVMESGFVPVASSHNSLSNSLIYIRGGNVEIGGGLKIGELSLSSTPKRAFIGIGNQGITIKENGVIEIGSIKLNTNGSIVAGKINSDLIFGTLSIEQGGTGITRYAPGDLLYANDLGQLSRLSTPSGEGWVIGSSESGMPTWIDLSSVKIDGGYRRVKLETDGDNLFFINAQKQRVLITATPPKQHNGIIPVNLGGTGDDLSAITRRGAILVAKNRDSWTAIQPGPSGHILSSCGNNEMPQWIEPPVLLRSGNGVKISDGIVSIDVNKSLEWSAEQSFNKISSSTLIVNNLRLKPFNHANTPSIGSIWTDGDDVYVQTRRGKRNMVNAASDTVQKRVISVTMPQADLSSIQMRDCNFKACCVMVPFSPVNPSTATKWKVLRIDVIPFSLSQNVLVNITKNGQSILTTPIHLLNTRVGQLEFIDAMFVSGDIIGLNIESDSASGFVNTSVLLEEYNG